jgi:hypothetical protein
MKKLHTFDFWESPMAAMYQELLSREGIKCLVKNDRLSAGIGEIPFVECFPELWLIDDEVYPRARLLLDAWMAQTTGNEDEAWICSHCQEQVAQQFEACWNCSRGRR